MESLDVRKSVKPGISGQIHHTTTGELSSETSGKACDVTRYFVDRNNIHSLMLGNMPLKDGEILNLKAQLPVSSTTVELSLEKKLDNQVRKSVSTIAFQKVRTDVV